MMRVLTLLLMATLATTALAVGPSSSLLRGAAPDRITVSLPDRDSVFHYNTAVTRGGGYTTQWFDIDAGADLEGVDCDAEMVVEMEGGERSTRPGYSVVEWALPTWWTQGSSRPAYNFPPGSVANGVLFAGVLSPNMNTTAYTPNFLPSPYVHEMQDVNQKKPGQMALLIKEDEIPEGATVRIHLTISKCNRPHTPLTLPNHVVLERPAKGETVTWTRTVTDGFDVSFHFKDPYSDTLFCRADVTMVGEGKAGTMSSPKALRGMWLTTWDPKSDKNPGTSSYLPRTMIAGQVYGVQSYSSESDLVGLSSVYDVQFILADLGNLDSVTLEVRVRDCVSFVPPTVV